MLKSSETLDHLMLTNEPDYRCNQILTQLDRVSNTPLLFCRLYYSFRALMSFACAMNFNEYPFDRHHCQLQARDAETY